MKAILTAIFSFSVLFMVGCSSNNETLPEDYVNQLFSQLQQGDFDELSLSEDIMEELDNDDNDTFIYILEDSLKNIEYNIISTTTEGNNATVTTEITTANLEYTFELAIFAALEEIINSIFSEDVDIEELDESIIDTIFLDTYNSGEAGTVTNIVHINLLQTGNEWSLTEDNNEFYNAISGNLYNLYLGMYDFTDMFDENSIDLDDNFLIEYDETTETEEAEMDEAEDTELENDNTEENEATEDTE